jgi:predicted kinase
MSVTVLHLMVGLPCSGKSTWARALEARTGALRLTPDEWHLRLFGQDADHSDHDRRHQAIEELMWEVAEVVLRRSGDVILDFGFWTRTEREEATARAARLGADTRIHYTEVPHEELLRRLRIRNMSPGTKTFIISEVSLRRWATLFEPPLTGDTGWKAERP